MPKHILVLNCGSSSIKYQLIDPDSEEVLAKGLGERIGGTSDGIVTHEVGDETWSVTPRLPDHTTALAVVFHMFGQHGPELRGVAAVAHRTVHGGDRFSAPTLITDDVVHTMQELIPLAPLHNPAGIEGIRAARSLLPDVPHVGIFDTAFFVNLPKAAHSYAVNKQLAERNKIRKYGFHGTSHQYVSGIVPLALGVDPKKLRQIVCHLGNGASVTAIDGGQPIETSMGLTPLAGLVMGTRSGDIDPGIFAYLGRTEGWNIHRIDTELNLNSGMVGMAGVSDMRDVEAHFKAGDQDAIDAMDIYAHRLGFYIGGYANLLGGVDAITFTAGVGENSAFARREICKKLAGIGVVLDEERNQIRDRAPHLISSDESKVKVLVVCTNEELAMAQQTAKLLSL